MYIRGYIGRIYVRLKLESEFLRLTSRIFYPIFTFNSYCFLPIPCIWVRILKCNLSQQSVSQALYFSFLCRRDRLSSWFELDSERQSTYQLSYEVYYSCKSTRTIASGPLRKVSPENINVLTLQTCNANKNQILEILWRQWMSYILRKSILKNFVYFLETQN